MRNQELIPNPVIKELFYSLARLGGLCPYNPTLEGAGLKQTVWGQIMPVSQPQC